MRREPQSGQEGIDAALNPRLGGGFWTLKAVLVTVIEAGSSVDNGKSCLDRSSDANGIGTPPSSYLHMWSHQTMINYRANAKRAPYTLLGFMSCALIEPIKQVIGMHGVLISFRCPGLTFLVESIRVNDAGSELIRYLFRGRYVFADSGEVLRRI